MSDKLRLLDLFSGIGGFSLGLERTGGFETVAFCEIDPFCQKVLRKHWPHVPQYQDVTKLTAAQLRADGITVDAICGGFPCQDISIAGSNAGMGEGTRSGLWSEYARIIGELRPRYAIVENVSALLGRGLDRVLGDLAALGYDAEWHCIPASSVGAPHRRDRIWIVAYPTIGGCESLLHRITKPSDACSSSAVSNSECFGSPGRGEERKIKGQIGLRGRKGRNEKQDVAYAEGWGRYIVWGGGSQINVGGNGTGNGAWEAEPNVGRVAHGVPARVDRLKSLGNAVVPQIPELIGRAILNSIGA